MKIHDIEDVTQRNEWFHAHYKELDGLFANPDLLRLIPLPTGTLHRDLLKLRTIYKVKADRTKKARTVLGGHEIHFAGRTFSPTPRPTTFRVCCCSVAASEIQWGS